MATLRPDPIFYPSPRQAMKAPPEELAYVVILNPDGNGRPDALAVMDVDPGSTTYQQVVGRVELGMGDEHGRRSSPLRLERLLGGPLPLRAPPARRAPIPARPRSEILTHLRHRHQTRPHPAKDRQDDRAR